jgi:hypothetical protein
MGGGREGAVFVSAISNHLQWKCHYPFVIPSVAEGSAVRPGSRTKVGFCCPKGRIGIPRVSGSSTREESASINTHWSAFGCSMTCGVCGQDPLETAFYPPSPLGAESGLSMYDNSR